MSVCIFLAWDGMCPQEIFAGGIRETNYLSLSMCLAYRNVCFYVSVRMCVSMFLCISIKNSTGTLQYFSSSQHLNNQHIAGVQSVLVNGHPACHRDIKRMN